MKYWQKTVLAVIILCECIPAVFIFVMLGLGHMLTIGPFDFYDPTIIPWIETFVAGLPIILAITIIRDAMNPLNR